MSHGVRCLAYEAAFSSCMMATGGTGELQAQALASALGTVLGTCVRIPMEICKQRLQVCGTLQGIGRLQVCGTL